MISFRFPLVGMMLLGTNCDRLPAAPTFEFRDLRADVQKSIYSSGYSYTGSVVAKEAGKMAKGRYQVVIRIREADTLSGLNRFLASEYQVIDVENGVGSFEVLGSKRLPRMVEGDPTPLVPKLEVQLVGYSSAARDVHEDLRIGSFRTVEVVDSAGFQFDHRGSVLSVDSTKLYVARILLRRVGGGRITNDADDSKDPFVALYHPWPNDTASVEVVVTGGAGEFSVVGSYRDASKVVTWEPERISPTIVHVTEFKKIDSKPVLSSQ